MLAVDTNIVVRLLVRDDAKQTAAADNLFAAGPIWIAKTVVLETCWVLHSLYGFDEDAIHEALINLFGLSNVYTEDKPCMAAALQLAVHGIELADAIHYSSRPPGAHFVSFDRSLIRRAQRAGATDISGVPATN